MIRVLRQRHILITLLIVALAILSATYTGGSTTPPLTKAALGRMLFFEQTLSLDSSVSCASCHRPDHGFADTTAFSTGIGGKHTKRNTPSVLNMKSRPLFFWDGRAASLEAQALMPIENPDEMGLPLTDAIARLRANPRYLKAFRIVFGRTPNTTDMAAAFAAFERTLETTNSAFDDWSNGLAALSPAAERGRKVFVGNKAKCFDCHFQEDFTADQFRNIGLFNGTTLNDSGRFLITRNPDDIGKFKTPGLRNVAITAPYMHNGMFRTLEAVVEYYDDPAKWVTGSINTDPLLRKPLHLTRQEKKDLVVFLKSLTDRRLARRKSKFANKVL